MLKSTAAILSRLNHPLEIKEITLPKNLASGQVLVKILATAICGSQIGEIQGIKGPDRFLPHLLGHEAIVEVLDSKDSSQLKRGNFAVAHWMKGSGKSSGPVQYFLGDTSINAGEIATFSEFAVISENRLTRVPEESLEEFGIDFLATIGCSFLTAFGTTVNDIGLANLDDVLLIGGGGVSQALVVILRCFGKNNITVVEPSAQRQEYLKSLGAKITYTHSSEIPKASRMYSAVIDLTGLAREIEFGYESLSDSGILALVGVTGTNERISIDPMPLHYGKKIKGVFGGGVQPNKDINKVLNLIRQNPKAISKIRYREVSVNDLNLGIKMMQEVENQGRVIVKMNP
jgi:Zn-dependent alcohol dehydrogenase